MDLKWYLTVDFVLYDFTVSLSLLQSISLSGFFNDLPMNLLLFKHFSIEFFLLLILIYLISNMRYLFKIPFDIFSFKCKHFDFLTWGFVDHSDNIN